MINRFHHWWRYWFGPLDLSGPWTDPVRVIRHADIKRLRDVIQEMYRGPR